MRSEQLDNREIIQRLRQNRSKLGELDVVRIGLFGSYANGTHNDESDIDFLVTFDELDFDTYMEAKFFLEDLFERNVDLVVEDDLKPSLQHVKDEAEYVAAL